MEDNKDNFGFGEGIQHLEQASELYPINGNSDKLEPLNNAIEYNEINTEDPADISRWAKALQVSEADLKSLIATRGNSVRAIKEYLGT